MKAIIYNVNPLGWLTCQGLRYLWPGCLLSRLNGLSLRQVNPPELPGDDWVRVRTLLGGICGTDLAILQLKQPANSILQAFGSMPMMLGHENVAVVEEAGAAVDPSWVGRRVCVEPTLNCEPRGIDPPCARCREGQFGACENFGDTGHGAYKLPAGTSIGYNRFTGGAYGEYFVAHQSQLVAADDSLSDEQLLLTDPAACSLHAVLRADLAGARRILVYGAGAIGLTAVAALRAVGYAGQIHLLGRGSYTCPMAAALGADQWLQLPGQARGRFEQIAALTGATVQRARLGSYMLSGGYDVVFDCVGSRQSINESLKWARARGQVVLVGTGHGGWVDLTPIWFRELQVIGAYGRQREEFQERRLNTYQLVHEFMRNGKLKLAGLLTHTFALEDYRQAFDVACHKSRHGAVKVAFDFRRPSG